MPTQQTDTVRILPVGQPDNREADPLKDQRFLNCYTETVVNPYSQTKKEWLVKRPGFIIYLEPVVIKTYSYLGGAGENDKIVFSGEATTALSGYDPYCDYITLLLLGNDYVDEVGADVDSGPAGAPGTGVSIDTTVKPFGEASIKYEGNAGDNNYYVLTQNGPKGALLGDAAYTIDIIFRKSTDTSGSLFENASLLATIGLFIQIYSNKLRVFYWDFGGNPDLWMTSPGPFGDITITDNVWTHIRLTRDASMNLMLYVSSNGGEPISYGPMTDTVGLDMTTDGSTIGYDTNVGAFGGHIKHVRTMKGIALDDSDMPATEEFTYNCGV